MVKCYHAKELSEASEGVRPREIHDGLDLLLDGADAVFVHDVAKELQRGLSKGALVRIRHQTKVFQTPEKLAEVILVHVVGRAGHQDVVQVDVTKVETMEDVVDEPLERLGSVAESKGHPDEFVHPKRCGNGRLWDVIGMDRNVMVSPDQIDLGEYSGIGQL